MKNPKITILFWALVIGFLNLVSVDAKERSKVSIISNRYLLELKLALGFLANRPNNDTFHGVNIRIKIILI